MTLWEKLSPDVKNDLVSAGWKPKSSEQLLTAPPGLGKGKGKGKPSPEATQVALWESATEAQRQMLEQLGLKEPVKEQPTDLKELVKSYMDQLPEGLREAVADLEPPEPEMSATRLVEEATKRFKTETTELRLLIQKSAHLQVRIDKAKTAYGDLLEQMKAMQTELTEKQATVAQLQKDLEAKVQSEIVSPKLPGHQDVLLALQVAGITLSPEQQAKLVGQEPEEMQTDQQPVPETAQADRASQQAPNARNPASEGEGPDGRRDGDGKGRSRSRGRGQAPAANQVQG